MLGARQVGKSTIAKKLISSVPGALYLDLEKNSDRMKLSADPELFLNLNRGKLICLDEIHMLPEIFSTLRAFIGNIGSRYRTHIRKKKGQYISQDECLWKAGTC